MIDDGRIRWLDSTANAFLAEDGKAHVVVVSRDVTAQRETQSALRDSEARYRMLAEHAPDMIVEHDENGRVVYANPRAIQFGGWSFEELARMPLGAWSHPDDLELCERAFEAVLREHAATRLVHRLLRANGEYAWVPLEQVGAVALNPPRFPRDLIWAPARLEVDGTAGEVFLPALYPGTHEAADDQLRLGRMTDWRSGDGGPVLGVGGRLFLADDDPIGLLEWRRFTAA